MTKYKVGRLGVVAILALPVLLLFGDVLVGSAALWGGDWSIVFHAYFSAFSQRWQSGHLALWAPEVGMGYPLFAEGQSLQLYPPMNLLLRLLPAWWAGGVLLATHYLIAALGTYGFCRRRHLPTGASILGALTFALSAPLTWRPMHPTVIIAVSLMPVFLCALDEALRARLASRVAIASLVLTLMLLGGQHQFTFYCLMLAAAYTLVLSPRLQEDEKVDGEVNGEARGNSGRSDALRRGGILVGAIVLAVGICTLPLAATQEMRSLTLRAALPREPFVTGFGLPIENLMLFFLPHWLGTVKDYVGESLLWESCGYSTILPFVAIFAAISARPRSRDLWFWVGVVGISLALAIVEGNPLYKILPHVPVFNWFRAPSRYLVLTVFALAMLLAHSFAILTALAGAEKSSHAEIAAEVENGTEAKAEVEVDHAIENLPSSVGALRRATQVLGGEVLLLLALWVVASVVFCNGQSVLWNGLFAPRPGFFHPVRTRMDVMFNSLAGWDGVFLFAHIAIGGGVLLLMLKRKVGHKVAAAVLAVLICADLGRVAQTMRERIEPEYFAFEPAAARFLRDQPGVFRVWTGECDLDVARRDPALRELPDTFVEKGFLRPNNNVLFQVPHADAFVGLDLLRPFNLVRPVALPPGASFNSGTDEATKTPITLRSAQAPLRARLMRLLNIRYVVTTSPMQEDGWRQAFPQAFPQTSRQGASSREASSRGASAGGASAGGASAGDASAGGVQVWENREVLPRAFLVGAVQITSPQDSLRTVLGEGFDPSRTAVIEDDIEDDLAVALPGAPPSGFAGVARLQSYGDTRMVLETQSAQPSMLIVSDAWFPGWRAWVDGVETPLLRANYALRGVALPAGRHQIVCAYRPRWWWPTLAASLCALLITLVMLAPAKKSQALRHRLNRRSGRLSTKDHA